jgi:hypothetical protein
MFPIASLAVALTAHKSKSYSRNTFRGHCNNAVMQTLYRLWLRSRKRGSSWVCQRMQWPPANTADSEKRPKLQAGRNTRLTIKQDPPLAPPRRENGRQSDPMDKTTKQFEQPAFRSAEFGKPSGTPAGANFYASR